MLYSFLAKQLAKLKRLSHIGVLGLTAAVGHHRKFAAFNNIVGPPRRLHLGVSLRFSLAVEADYADI